MHDDPVMIMPGINLGLIRISRLLTLLSPSSPHLQIPIIHIAGTNGKGSIASYLSNILLKSGIRVGKFTSPFLVDEWDCISLDGTTIEREVYERMKEKVEKVNEVERVGCSSFEILTATAFSLFENTTPSLNCATIEVGMGGATDATNVVDSDRTLLSIITSIELDHQKFLGETLEEIARVKGGIMKARTDVVIAKQGHTEVVSVLKEIGERMGSNLYFADQATPQNASSSLVSIPLYSSYNELHSPSTTSPLPTESISTNLPLPGSYQLQNSAAATLAAQLLSSSLRTLSILPLLSAITPATIASGIATTVWPGRLSWISLPPPFPAKVLLDGAHNPSSALLLAQYLDSLEEEVGIETLIIGISFPRPPITILKPLLKKGGRIKRVICVPFSLPASMDWIRCTETREICEAVKEMNLGDEVTVIECEDVETALRKAQGATVVAGSLYLVADVYRLLRRLESN